MRDVSTDTNCDRASPVPSSAFDGDTINPITNKTSSSNGFIKLAFSRVAGCGTEQLLKVMITGGQRQQRNGWTYESRIQDQRKQKMAHAADDEQRLAICESPQTAAAIAASEKVVRAFAKSPSHPTRSRNDEHTVSPIRSCPEESG